MGRKQIWYQNIYYICVFVCLRMMLTRNNGTPNLIETSIQTIHWDCVESYVLLLLLAGLYAIHRSKPSLFSAYYVLSYSFFCFRHLCFDQLLVRSRSCSHTVVCIVLHFSRIESVWEQLTLHIISLSLCVCVLRAHIFECFSFSFLFLHLFFHILFVTFCIDTFVRKHHTIFVCFFFHSHLLYRCGF